MTNLSAFRITLRELKRLGRVERIDTAWIEAVRSMAVMLDQNPGSAALWRQYLEALGVLTADVDDGSLDDALEELYGKVRDAPSS